MQVAFLIPNKGAIVRDPKTKEPLPIEGKMLSLLGSEGRYWRRRIRDKSVKIGAPSIVQKKVHRKFRDKKEVKGYKGD